MKENRLYSILGLEAPKPKPVWHVDVILSNNYRELFKLARESVEDNSSNFIVVSSDLSIKNYNSNVITYFNSMSNGSSTLRGLSIRNLYIDETFNDTEVKEIKTYFCPMAKNVIFEK